MHLLDDILLTTIDGKPMWLEVATGRTVPLVRGAAEGDPPPDPPADPPAYPPPATFTQDDLDRIVGREKAEARRAAERQLADTLGVTVDEAKAIIAEKAAADEATKSEAQKALEAAQRAQADADAARADAARERFEAKVERKLTAAGVDEKAIARAIRLVNLDPDADDDAIASEIETLKADVPGLFTTTPPPAGGGRPPSGVTGARPPAGGHGTVTPLERGRELWKSQQAS